MIPIKNALDARIFGNKAKNLAILINNCFNVPRGFVIPSDYLRNLSGKSSHELNDQILMQMTPKNPFREDSIVRSSSILEDNNLFSAAGLYYSGKCNESNYSKELVKVWKSPYSDSAISFKKKFNLPIIEDIAAIVMEYVPAKQGGVLFTRHPSFKEMILELSNNGAAGVTSGESKSELYELPKDMDSHPLFNKLYEDSKKIKEIFGVDQDIEFLFENNSLVYLQTRPIVFKKHKLH